MSNYNPKIRRRKSLRVKGHDYSQPGMYFITICIQNRKHLFGFVENGSMILNNAGQMVEKWYYELENKFPDIKCHEMSIMPDHFHCIIENIGTVTDDGDDGPGADLRVCPMMGPGKTIPGEHGIQGEHIGSPLFRVVQWFKTMSTNEYIRGVKNCGWQRFDGKLWQRNYWERTICDKKSYEKISKYIIDNPLNWGIKK